MLRALSLLAVATALPSTGAAAQTFEVGRLPRDVLIEVDEEPYANQANSAEGILQQLTLRGPGRGWVTFPLFSRWTPSLVDVSIAMGDLVDIVRQQGTAWRGSR